jgi:hypothetical protein
VSLAAFLLTERFFKVWFGIKQHAPGESSAAFYSAVKLTSKSPISLIDRPTWCCKYWPMLVGTRSVGFLLLS